MRRGGYTLLAVLWFVGFALAMTLASAVVVGGVRARLTRDKFEQAAAACAVSGADYAQTMLKWKQWNRPGVGSQDQVGDVLVTTTLHPGAKTPIVHSEWTRSTFTSPDLNGSGSFTVTVRQQGTHTLIHSVGHCGSEQKSVDRVLP